MPELRRGERRRSEESPPGAARAVRGSGRRAGPAARLALVFAGVLGTSVAALGADVSYTIETFAGSGVRGSRDGSLREAEFYDPGHLALADDGTMYVSDNFNGVRRIRDGMVSTLPLLRGIGYAAGVVVRGATLYLAIDVPEEDEPDRLRSTVLVYDLESDTVRDLLPGNCHRRQTPYPWHCLNRPQDLALMDDVILAGTFFHSTVYAFHYDGGHPFLYAGQSDEPTDELGVGINEGGAAQGARILTVTSIDVDPRGNLYVGDSNHCLVRQVDPKGIIRTVAGGKGSTEDVREVGCGDSGDGGPAVLAALGDHLTVKVGRNRDLFIAHRRKIRYVDATGRISTVAGKDDSVCAAEGGCCAGDGGPALEADLERPIMGAVAADGAVYFLETDGCSRVRVLRPIR